MLPTCPPMGPEAALAKKSSLGGCTLNRVERHEPHGTAACGGCKPAAEVHGSLRCEAYWSPSLAFSWPAAADDDDASPPLPSPNSLASFLRLGSRSGVRDRPSLHSPPPHPPTRPSSVSRSAALGGTGGRGKVGGGAAAKASNTAAWLVGAELASSVARESQAGSVGPEAGGGSTSLASSVLSCNAWSCLASSSRPRAWVA
jgi:hypothetical protein